MSLKAHLKAIIRPTWTAFSRRRRQGDLKRRLKPIDECQLIQELQTVDLPPKPVVVVHSSLKSLGFVEGGPEAVVNALVEVIVREAGGTVMLPTFSIDGSMLQTLEGGRSFNAMTTPSNLGAIPETFRRRKEACRSAHPTHSFAAIGHQAAWLVDAHHLCGTSFGRDSPMHRAMTAGGILCGLGTSLGNVTFYHCLEDQEPAFPVQVYEDRLFELSVIDRHGQTHRVNLPGHARGPAKNRIDHPDNDVLRQFFRAWFERHAGLGRFHLGEAECWRVEMSAMFEQCRRLMRGGITIYSPPSELSALSSQLPASDLN